MATGYAAASLPGFEEARARDLTAILSDQPRSRERIAAIAGLAINVGVLSALVVKLHSMPAVEAAITIPAAPGFWILLLLSWFAAPAIDWFILRLLWRLPVTGFGALLRKQSANELFLGYSGDAHFYLWARARLPKRAAPFGTLRDLSIMSALAGNLATLVMMAAAWPWFSALAGGHLLREAAIAVLAIVGSSLGVFAARQLFFTFALSRHALVAVFVAHLGRIALSLILGAMLWATLLPSASFATLLVLATLRAMISRLPLVPGKDALFAGAALAVSGNAGVAGATATVAMLTIGLHALVAIAGTARDLTGRGSRCSVPE